MRSVFGKILQFLLIFMLSVGWIFSGWPQIYNFPPKIQEAQAAFTSRTETTADSGSQTAPYDLSISTPGGVTDGDIMFLWAGLNASTVDSIDASWNLLGSYTVNSDKYYLYYKIAAGEPASYTVSAAASGRIKLVMTAYSAGDWDSNNPINVVSNTAYRTSSSVARAASMNVAAVNSPLLYFGGLYNTSNNSWTKPANIGSDAWIEDYDNRNATSDFSLEIASMIWSGSGSTGNIDGTNSLTAQTTKHAFAVALNPPPPVVDTPAYDNGTATYNNDVSVTITVASPATAVICYTTDGSTPAAATPGTCSNGTTYSGAVSITATGTVLKAIGTKAGCINSAVQSATYTLAVASPGFGTNGGSFFNDTSTSFSSATAGAVFCSTLDGSTPAASTPGTCSAGATGASATVIATGTAVKVLGTKANYANSAVQTSNTFTLTVGAITSSPGAGTYSGTQSVSLNIATTTGAVAHYTTDGSAVTCSSATYSGAFNVSSTKTVKAIGCKTNYVSDTAISDLYTINLSTAIEVRAQDYSTSVSSIIFPEGVSGAAVSQPYNNVDTNSSPQTFGGAGSAKPVVTLYNGNASALTIWYNVSTFTNGVVSDEYYLINAKGAAANSASDIASVVTFGADTATGSTIAAGAGNEKDLYLKITLGSLAGKSGSSTLTILGESL